MKIQLVFILVIFLAIIAVHPQGVTAKTLIFSESFDNPHVFDQWSVVRNRQWQYPLRVCTNVAQPAVWQIVTGRAQIVIDSKPCVMEIVPNEFTLSQAGPYLFSIDVTLLESVNMDRNLLFLWVDENNWYDIKVTNNEIRLQKVVNGLSYELPNSVVNYPFEVDKPYHVEVVFSEQIIRLRINNSAVLAVADSSPFIQSSFMKIGLEAGVGALRRSVSQFDNLQVFRLETGESTALVPSLKQHDSSWSNLEYDHASEWSNKITIRNWGCALTSLVMIMQYHGIVKMPDGTALTPSSLNDWFNLQPDGYLGQGLVNFLAATRLTKQLSVIFGTPALEYGRVNWNAGSALTPAIQEITEGRPVMVQIPGHFMVADGITTDQNDLLIKDPAYTYTTFGQHQINPLSFRMFYPSFTDLSYLLIVQDPTITLSISGGDQTEETTIEEQLSAFSDDGTSEVTQPLVMHLIAKPAVGQYQITVNSESSDTISFTVYTYDANGEVTQHLVADKNLGVPRTYVLNYLSDQPSTLMLTSNFKTFRQILEQLFINQAFQHPLAWWWLDHASEQALQHPTEVTLYKQYVKKLLNWYQTNILADAQATLLQELAIIPE